MKKINRYLLIVIVVAFYSCDDVFEDDISDDIIQIVSPLEQDIIQGNTVLFSWQNLDGADDYNIQVINDFQQVEIDSTVSSTSLSLVLNSGDYQWRIRGKNFAYETQFNFPVNFSVETSENLDNQSVVLLTPSSDLFTNDPENIFTWTGISSADSYDFDLVKHLNGGQETVLQISDITETSFSPDAAIFDVDAEYIWNVRALNDTSETPFSSRSLFIDREVPNLPTLNSPLDNEISNEFTVTFNWSNGTDTGNVQSEITNTIEIASDIDFNSIIYTTATTNNSSQYTFGAAGIYYWRIKAIDAATNESDFSIFRTLEIL